MRVEYTRRARLDLDEIWDWNDTRFGTEHATQYTDFLEGEISRLGVSFRDGKPVEGHPGYLRTVLRRSSKGHGHVVVYRVDEAAQTVRVLHVFHTAQDWRGRLDETGP